MTARCCRLVYLPLKTLEDITLGRARIRNLPSDAVLVDAHEISLRDSGFDLLYSSIQFPPVPIGKGWPRMTAEVEKLP